MFVLVAIPRSTLGLLTYKVGLGLETLVAPGSRVRVPLRGREVTGIVQALSATSDVDHKVIREVQDVLDAEPLLPGHLLELAGFVASHYRCSPGETLAAMMPSSLIRADVIEVELLRAGAGFEVAELPEKQGLILKLLQQEMKLKLTALLARTGTQTATPIAALEKIGLVRIKRRRRDRAPQTEVSAVSLSDQPLEDLLARCSRSPKGRLVIEWLAQEGRPALISEVCAEVGCSTATVRTLIKNGQLDHFSQAPARKPRWSLGGAARPILTDEQGVAVEALSDAINAGGFSPFLLQGVTGSGKTEVYLRCLELVLSLGQTGIVLVPEIGLTPAASGAVERRFGDRVAVLHSAQSEGERWREWQRAASGEVRIVVGPRSALFTPLPNLGIIIVDEEHDGAYKQQDAPRYNARDLSLVLGQRLKAPVLLCSATPSAEAAALVKRGMATRLGLDRRVGGGALPKVEGVDLRLERHEPGEQGRTLFSRRLIECMEETLQAGHQVILLMQRRGWAPVLMCRECGIKVECSSCSVSLVVHQRSNDLRCHYCGARAVVPKSCSSCSGTLLDALGAGTEKVAHHLKRLFPDVSAAILDRDTVRRRNGLEETLGAFAAGRLQVLVGTQMVAKGHHFPNVTLTGVISADAMLSLPDFRAGERTFQLITQAAGRAGRGEVPGRVIVQTYYPDHPSIRHAASHDVDAFLEEELHLRRAFFYPPAARMAVVRFEASDLSHARQAAEEAARVVGSQTRDLRLRGPSAAPLERVRNKWRWQVLISTSNHSVLREVLDRINQCKIPNSVKRIIDIDPLSTL